MAESTSSTSSTSSGSGWQTGVSDRVFSLLQAAPLVCWEVGQLPTVSMLTMKCFRLQEGSALVKYFLNELNSPSGQRTCIQLVELDQLKQIVKFILPVVQWVNNTVRSGHRKNLWVNVFVSGRERDDEAPRHGALSDQEDSVSVTVGGQDLVCLVSGHSCVVPGLPAVDCGLGLRQSVSHRGRHPPSVRGEMKNVRNYWDWLPTWVCQYSSLPYWQS